MVRRVVFQVGSWLLPKNGCVTLAEILLHRCAVVSLGGWLELEATQSNGRGGLSKSNAGHKLK